MSESRARHRPRLRRASRSSDRSSSRSDVELVQAAEDDGGHARRWPSDGMTRCSSASRRSRGAWSRQRRGGCRVISRYGVGYDNIDLDAAARARASSSPTSPTTASTRSPTTRWRCFSDWPGAYVGGDRSDGGGSVERCPKVPVHSLRGQRLAVIGAGAVGRRVIERRSVVRYRGSRVRSLSPMRSLDGIERAETLEDAIAEADAISLHVPLTPENETPHRSRARSHACGGTHCSSTRPAAR